ncbi:hypothetical protein AAC691_10915 [Nguyenibacter vanlangensis]|uniref:Uncharacterized protein n=1 Tax=Nguyenibacter vanlangensis TaxID=1216886 RepID=A0ABZ3DAS2_9PROT
MLTPSVAGQNGSGRFTIPPLLGTRDTRPCPPDVEDRDVEDRGAEEQAGPRATAGDAADSTPAQIYAAHRAGLRGFRATHIVPRRQGG